MLNGKMSFDIQNVPARITYCNASTYSSPTFLMLFRGAKGLMQLKIDPSKKQIINKLLHETFPSLKCFDNEKLCVINPKTVANVHALIINGITIPFEGSINSRAHEHEGAMVEVYTKMKPDSFRSQLQTAFTNRLLRGHHGDFRAPAVAARQR
jgi:hypothetical protein